MFDDNHDRTCPYYHQAEATSHHLWHCMHPDLQAARRRDASALELVVLTVVDFLPLPLLHGIVPSMQVHPDCPYWEAGQPSEHPYLTDLNTSEKTDTRGSSGQCTRA